MAGPQCSPVGMLRVCSPPGLWDLVDALPKARVTGSGDQWLRVGAGAGGLGLSFTVVASWPGTSAAGVFTELGTAAASQRGLGQSLAQTEERGVEGMQGQVIGAGNQGDEGSSKGVKEGKELATPREKDPQGACKLQQGGPGGRGQRHSQNPGHMASVL